MYVTNEKYAKFCDNRKIKLPENTDSNKDITNNF